MTLNKFIIYFNALLAATDAPDIFESGGGFVLTSGFCPPFIDQSALFKYKNIKKYYNRLENKEYI